MFIGNEKKDIPTEIQRLSPRAKIIQKNAESRQSDNKFIEVGPGEKKILQFNPKKIEQVQAELTVRKV